MVEWTWDPVWTEPNARGCGSLSAVEWPLLAPLAESDRERLLAATRPRHYDRQEILFHEDDPGDCLHLVRSGRLGVYVSLASGESFTLNVMIPGDAFGELALFGRPRRRTATVMAWEPVETLALTGERFASLCESHPAIERLVVSLLAERVDLLSRRLLEALYISVDRRVYHRLSDLCTIYGGEPGTVIPLTQDDIAGLAGASRPTVNQILGRLAANGVLTI